MKILSLFDGMSCGRIACDRAAIPVSQYFASEIDKHAIAVSRKNYPNIIQLGDVRVVRQMAQAGVFGHIDLLIGGSPCQGFSFAGQQLAFNDPRSTLFFEYVWTLQALREFNPNIKFLLENVPMNKKYIQVINQTLGVEGVLINSSLVSAQNRKRYYWANWSFQQPQDKGIFIKHVFDGEEITSRFLAKRKGTRSYKNANSFLRTIEQKTKCLMTGGQGISNAGATNIIIENKYYKPSAKMAERLQTVPDNYTDGCGVSNTERHKMLGNGWTIDVIAHILRSMPL